MAFSFKDGIVSIVKLIWKIGCDIDENYFP